jgi:hypothetical protein
MKKYIFILLMAVFASMSLNGCTEEEIAPSTELNGGGAAMDPK